MSGDIEQWLQSLGLEKYATLFAENDVDLEVVPELSDDELKELGVSLGHRKKLLKAIAALKQGSGAVADAGAPSARPVAERPRAEAERRQLTIMFCDLVGSTELSARLDPEDLRDIMRRYQDSVAGAVTRYGGYVAKYLGDWVLAYFGWPQAHEDQAERAVRTGLDAVAQVESIRLDGGSSLRARVGIATGRVVVGDLVGDAASDEEAVSGETPNLAARLQAVAEPGRVVIGPATRRLIGPAFDLEDLGLLTLKGFPRAIAAWRVVGESAAESRFEAAHADSLTRLVGREHELALLRERWELAKGGEGQAVLLSGEAGIGKSRIVRAVRELVGDDRHYRLRYQCSPYHANSAFHPIIQRLERAAGMTGEDPVEVKLDKLEALLGLSAVDLKSIASLFAALLSLPAKDRYGTLDLTPGQRRNQTFAALVGQVLALSRQRPVLFVMEDVHWIDPTTQDFVGEVIAQVADAAVLVLVTHRPEYVSQWTGFPHATSLALNRLSREQAAGIVEAIGGAKLDDAVAERIVARADGVPRFVEELTKSVLEASETAGQPIAADAIPATLQASLTASLDRLDEAKRIAQMGAALGREYSHELIAAVSGETEPNLGSALDRLVDAELVFRTVTTRNTIYTFKHALIQEVAHESMLKSRRTELHRRIAETLETMFPAIVETEPEVLARHYSMANMVDPAIAYWRRAGELSVEASANSEAASHFENALGLLASLPEGDGRDELELELRIALGGPLLMTRGHGAPEVGETYLRARELCAKLGNSPQIVPALFGMWRFYIGRGDCTITRDLGRQLLELGERADDMPAIVLGHYGLGFSLFCYGDLKEARVQLEDGYKLYDRNMRDDLSFRLGQDPGVACLSYCALALWVLGYCDQAKHTTQKALTLAEELSHPFSSAYALSLACQVYQHRGEVDELRKVSEAAISISREQGFSVWIASPTIFRGWVRAQQDNAIEGAQEAHDAVQIVAAGMEMRRPYYLALVAECHLSAGHFAEARLILDEALAIVAETDEHWSEAELLRLTGEIEARDDAARAETTFRRALDIARSQHARSWELRSATSLARLWREEGKAAAAETLLRPIHDWFTEGFETRDLRNARTLLDELS